ncbi:hypothetical protein GCK32_013677, partial [Trichostrongylus colubriformis]
KYHYDVLVKPFRPSSTEPEEYRGTKRMQYDRSYSPVKLSPCGITLQVFHASVAMFLSYHNVRMTVTPGRSI